jgi:hypothetical protein
MIDCTAKTKIRKKIGMKAHLSRWFSNAGMAMLFAALLLFVVPSAVLADSFDWTVVGGGSVSFAGGSNPLKGTGITVSAVSDVDTSATINILHGILRFTTGNLTGSNATQWFFDGNSSPTAITITGCIDNDADGGACDAQDTPVSLQGKITDAAVSKAVPGASFATALFDLTDVIDSASVCTALGAPVASCGPGSGGGNMLLQVAAGAIPPGGFSSIRALSGDAFSGASVPESGSRLLFPLALAALSIFYLLTRRLPGF